MNARINTEREIGADFGLESTPFVPSIVPMIPIAVEPSFRHVESGCQARDTVKRDAVSHDELSPTESNPPFRDTNAAVRTSPSTSRE